jgi:pimeloyl-ACP methyl ester carboxylesterase
MNVDLNGVSIFVGQGSMPWREGQRTLLLQHGAGMDRTMWVLLARYFARYGFNVITADLPEHGASKGKTLTSIEAMAEHIWSLVDLLRAEHGLPTSPVILGGHSMGSLIAVEAAAHRVDEVEQLVLFGTGYPMTVGKPLLDAAEANSQMAVDMIASFGHAYGSQLGHNPVAGISVVNSAKALLERSAPGVLHNDLKACNDYTTAQEAAKALAGKPCTLITGTADRMTPNKAAKNLASLLNAKVVELSNCGHMLLSEQPEATLQAVKKALLT